MGIRVLAASQLNRFWLVECTESTHGHREGAKVRTRQGGVISLLLANLYLHWFGAGLGVVIQDAVVTETWPVAKAGLEAARNWPGVWPVSRLKTTLMYSG